MSLLHIESFEGYDRDTVILNGGKYENWMSESSEDLVISNSYGRNSSTGLRLFTNSYTFTQRGSVTRHLNGNYDTIIVGAAIRLDNPNQSLEFTGNVTSHRTIFALADGSTIQAALSITPSMRLQVTQGESGSVLGRSTFYLHTGIFYYIEFKCLVSNTAGTFEVKVDGITRLTGGGDTQMSADQYINAIRLGAEGAFGTGSSGRYVRFDDVYIANTTVSTVYNDFIGDVRIEGLRPIGDRLTKQWVPSSGTVHFDMVDDLTPDTSNYITSGTIGDIDLFSVSSLLTPAGSILAVTPNMYARKTNAGVARIAAVVNRAGTNAFGEDQYLTQENRYHYNDVWVKNPIDNSQWASNLSSIYFGIKKSG